MERPENRHNQQRHEALTQMESQPYQGPDVVGQGGLRAAVFGAVGWFAGRFMGRVGSQPELDAHGRPNPAHHPFKKNMLGGLFAFVGAVMGAYGGSKDARQHREQVEGLQKALREEHGRADVLADAVQGYLHIAVSEKHETPTTAIVSQAEHQEKVASYSQQSLEK
jgi:hypothetical protein